MDRRNFLAFIPSFAAIPLIGKEIIQEKKKITIVEPEPIQIPDKPAPIDLMQCELVLRHKGKDVAVGYVRSLTIESPIHNPVQIDVEGSFFNIEF